VTHPYRDVAIVGVHNTPQARELPGHDSSSIALEGATGALADAGIPVTEVDGVVGEFAADWILELGLGPCSRRSSRFGIPMLLDAAALVASGECDVVVVGAGGAGTYTERAATAPPSSRSWRGATWSRTGRRPSRWPRWPRPSATTVT
jgi:acetyl-CoA acetyltransferase